MYKALIPREHLTLLLTNCFIININIINIIVTNNKRTQHESRRQLECVI